MTEQVERLNTPRGWGRAEQSYVRQTAQILGEKKKAEADGLISIG